MPLRAVGFFVLAGLFGPGIGRLLSISGLRRLDTPVYIPLQTSVHPLIAVTGGIALFGEQISVLRGAGAAGIVAGIWMLTRSRMAAELVDGDGAVAPPAGARRTAASGLAFLFPVGAGLSFGMADLTTKEALLDVPSAAFGALISIAASCVVWTALALASSGIRSQVKIGAGSRWFVLHGALASLAIISAYAALQRGDVSIVSPIIASQPFAVLVLSALFLHRIETVTGRTVIGSVLVVAGAVLVSLS